MTRLLLKRAAMSRPLARFGAHDPFRFLRARRRELLGRR
jgi:hypothetical protein